MGRHRKFGFSFSWKRALGISSTKGKISRAIGIPLTRSGRQRKAGRFLGDAVGTALIAATTQPHQLGYVAAQSEPDYGMLIHAIRPGDSPESARELYPALIPHGSDLSDGRGMNVLVSNGRIYAVRISFPYVGDLNALAQDASHRLSIPEDAIWNPNFPNEHAGFWEFNDTLVTVELQDNLALVATASRSLTPSN